MNFVRSHILVCTGTGCSSSNSPAIIEAFEQELKAQGGSFVPRISFSSSFLFNKSLRSLRALWLLYEP